MDEKTTRESQLAELELPGWYRDTRGVLCIMVHNRLVSLFVEDDGDFAVLVEAPDETGCFTKVALWQNPSTLEDAVKTANAIVGTICNQLRPDLVDAVLQHISRKPLGSMQLH